MKTIKAASLKDMGQMEDFQPTVPSLRYSGYNIIYFNNIQGYTVALCRRERSDLGEGKRYHDPLAVYKWHHASSSSGVSRSAAQAGLGQGQQAFPALAASGFPALSKKRESRMERQVATAGENQIELVLFRHDDEVAILNTAPALLLNGHAVVPG